MATCAGYRTRARENKHTGSDRHSGEVIRRLRRLPTSSSSYIIHQSEGLNNYMFTLTFHFTRMKFDHH